MARWFRAVRGGASLDSKKAGQSKVNVAIELTETQLDHSVYLHRKRPTQIWAYSPVVATRAVRSIRMLGPQAADESNSKTIGIAMDFIK